MSSAYETLGISKTASAAEIKKAYHKLARALHPDVNPDKKSAEKFKKISAAYDLLSDTDKRKKYDAGIIDENGNPTPFGHGAYDRGGTGTSGNPFGAGFGGFGGGRGGRTQYQTHNINPEDLAGMFGGMGGTGGFNFSDLFGMGGNRARSGHPFGDSYEDTGGQNVNYDFTIPIELAIKGGETTVNMNGKNLKIKIPAGTMPGATLRLKGLGQAGLSGVAGDAHIKIHIADSFLYRLDGANIIMDLPVSLADAVLGGKISLPPPFDGVKLTIPEYSSSGKVLRLKGKGMGGTGDLLVKLSIQIPAHDSALHDFVKKWKK